MSDDEDDDEVDEGHDGYGKDYDSGDYDGSCDDGGNGQWCYWVWCCFVLRILLLLHRFCALVQTIFIATFNSNIALGFFQATTPVTRSTTTLKRYGFPMARLRRECSGSHSNSTIPFRSLLSVLRRKSTNPNALRPKSTSKDRAKNISALLKRCGYCVTLCRRVTSEYMAKWSDVTPESHDSDDTVSRILVNK